MNKSIFRKVAPKQISKDGIRTVEIHTNCLKRVDRLVLKEHDKVIVEIQGMLDVPNIEKSHIVQDFFENGINYNQIFVDFFREYVAPIIKDIWESVTIFHKNILITWKESENITVRLCISDVVFERTYSNKKSRRCLFQQICHKSIAKLMGIQTEDILILFLVKCWYINADTVERNARFGRIYTMEINGRTLRISDKVYKIMGSQNYLLESHLLEEDNFFVLDNKQIAYITKAKMLNKPCVINELYMNRTVKIVEG